MTTSEKPVAHGTTPAPPKPGQPILSGNGQDSGTAQNVQLLGIDLGTSRSSIVAMNGTRRTIESFVGWPKDAVSRKLFNSEVVFGRSALDNRLALDYPSRHLFMSRTAGEELRDQLKQREYS